MAELEITEELINQIEEKLSSGDGLSKIIEELHPSDIAEIIEKKLSDENKLMFFRTLDSETAAEVLTVVNDDTLELLMEKREAKHIAQMVEEMESDDAADFLSELDDEKSQEVISHLPLKDSTEVRSLLQYPEDSAGGIMQLELVALQESDTCKDAIRKIRENREEVPELHYIFIIDEDEKLVGDVSLPQLILNPKERILSEIMGENPLAVSVTSDVEEVAQLFRKYDIVSLPVIDDEKRLLGRIMHDDVIDVITEENTEDMLKVAGTDEQEFDTASWMNAIRFRLPWLISSMLGGIIISGIISSMGAPLEHAIVLASFIPVISGMGGNVSTQSSAIVVRSIVLGKMNGSGVFSYIQKEVLAGFSMALFCGTLIGLIAWVLKSNPWVGMIVAVSLFFSMTAASFVGTVIPLILNRLDADPVLGAGPVVLTLVDMTSITIYLSVAEMMISHIN